MEASRRQFLGVAAGAAAASALPVAPAAALAPPALPPAVVPSMAPTAAAPIYRAWNAAGQLIAEAPMQQVMSGAGQPVWRTTLHAEAAVEVAEHTMETVEDGKVVSRTISTERRYLMSGDAITMTVKASLDGEPLLPEPPSPRPYFDDDLDDYVDWSDDDPTDG